MSYSSSNKREATILDATVAAGTPWSAPLMTGQTLTIVDLEGQQAVDALFYSLHNHAERYSAQDTLRAQGKAYVIKDTRLLSTEGNTMLTVIEDSCGLHDTSAGACSCESNSVRFGHQTRYMHACRENFLLELAKYGMGKRDLVSNVNFFMNVPILPNGELAIVDGVSQPGSYIKLRAEMDVLCVLSNCPQINNPCNDFNPTPIRVLIRLGSEG
jgi:uncharacterized protein